MSNNQPQAGPTFLTTWITLINQGNLEYLAADYPQSWKTFKALFTWLPLDCKEDCRKLRDEIEAQFSALSKKYSYSYPDAKKRLTGQLNNYLYTAIPVFAELVEASLETRKWIHREEFGAAPRSQNQPHIGT